MTDAYEQEQMPGVGAVLLRRKVTSPRWIMGLMSGIPLAVGVLGGAGLALAGLQWPEFGFWPALGTAVGGIGLAALFTVINVMFSSARIAVSEGELHVQMGFAGPRIPIASIRGVRLDRSGINKMGMGVLKDLRGKTWYTLWGDNAQAVHVEHDAGTLILVVKEPEAIAAAIQEALARHQRKTPKVRVELGGESDETIEQSESEQAARGRRSERRVGYRFVP